MNYEEQASFRPCSYPHRPLPQQQIFIDLNNKGRWRDNVLYRPEPILQECSQCFLSKIEWKRSLLCRFVINCLALSFGMVCLTVLVTPGSLPYFPQLTSRVQTYTNAAAQKPGLKHRILHAMTTNEVSLGTNAADQNPGLEYMSVHAMTIMKQFWALLLSGNVPVEIKSKAHCIADAQLILTV